MEERGPDGKPLVRLVDGVGAEPRDPAKIIASLSRTDIAAMREDVDRYLDLEVNTGGPELVIKYWRAVLAICDDALGRHRTTLPLPIDEAVRDSCAGCTSLEIARERGVAEVHASDRSNSAADQEYWRGVAARLAAEEARAIALEVNRELVRVAEKAGRGVHSVTAFREPVFGAGKHRRGSRDREREGGYDRDSSWRGGRDGERGGNEHGQARG